MFWWFEKWVIVQIWIEQRTITLFSPSSDLIILVRSDLVVDPLISGWSGLCFLEDELLVISWNSFSFLESKKLGFFSAKLQSMVSKPLGPLKWSPTTRFRMYVIQANRNVPPYQGIRIKWLNYPFFSVVAQLWIACLGEPANLNPCCFFYR